MAWAPKRQCAHPGCNELVNRGRCTKHERQQRQELDAKRGTAASRGYGNKWQRLRKQYLREHPLCVRCHRIGRLIPATVVDHITPHSGDMRLFWDVNNLQALCKPCHDKKTAKEDGRWTNSWQDKFKHKQSNE